MYVINRKGNKEPVHFDTITERISKLLSESDTIDPVSIAQKIVSRMYSGIKTTELDDLASQICMSAITDDPSYGNLASKLIISDNHKNTNSDFVSTLEILYGNMDILGENAPLISLETLSIAKKYREKITAMIDYKRDYLLDFFAFKTLEKAYLLKVNKNVVERPQHLFMRVAIGIHGDDIDNIVKTYDLLSRKYFTHATPTLFHAGTNHQQLSSCFLETIEDSVEGIFETIGDSAQISKWAGGIGLSISNIRSSGSYIRKTGGKSDGILPLLKTLNSVACYINQCFTPNTIVYTSEGPVEISSITPYDLVVTHNGSFKPVLGIKKSAISKQILVINSTSVTDEHQIYSIPSSMGLNNIDLSLGKYISAKDLKIGDILCFPIPDNSYATIVDNDVVKFYSLILKNGNIHQNMSSRYNLFLNVNGENEITFVKDFLDCKDIGYSYIENDNTFKVDISHEIMKKSFNFNRDDLYDKNGFKIISPFFMSLSDKNTKIIIDNVFDNKKVYRSDSVKFLECLRYCLLKIGVLSEINKNEIRIMDAGEYIRIKKCLYTLVKSITTVKYDGDVYDLNIEDNHNYLTEMGLVHNSGKRNGSFAIYIEPWHPDIFAFLDAKKNHGAEETRARDLFYALWVPDLFMKRVEANDKWTLFCPDTCPLLYDTYGDEFEKLYTEYESNPKRVRKVVKAREVWSAIISTQIEAGVPYILYKDACNIKSNQKNLGTIRSSNLCSEIIQYSSKDEISTCNLASICLPKFLEEEINEDYLSSWGVNIRAVEKYSKNELLVYTKEDCVYCKLLKKLFKKTKISYTEITKDKAEEIQKLVEDKSHTYLTVPQVFYKTGECSYEYLGGYDEAWKVLCPKINYKKLADISGVLVENLNKIIDRNYYPVEKCKKSNMRHRPMGIGIQGLADVFIKLRMPFESIEAGDVNKKIFEAIYYGAMKKSMELSKRDGAYETFIGSPLSDGKFQFNLWGLNDSDLSGMFDWGDLRKDVMKYGARNSLLTAVMPTASTSQIMGNNECIEPYTSNVYTRRTIAGEFTVVNNYLLEDLITLDLWDNDTKDRLMYDRGSVQKIKGFPKFLKDVYKTVWEIKQKRCIEMSAERSPFICQSQSLNIWLESPNFNTLTSAHFLGWKLGLKTGSYYVRSKPAVAPQRFGFNIEKELKLKNEDDKECFMCSA